MGFTKSKPDIITSQDYKKLNNNVFRSEIQSLSSSEADLGFFKDSIFHIFNNYAPIMKKYLRANEAPFMNKEVHFAIMNRSRHTKIKNQKLIFLQSWYKKITNNIIFWEAVAPLFTNKPSKSENILTNEGDKSRSDEEKKNCQIYNTFFSNVVSNLSYLILLIIYKEGKFHSLSAIIEHFQNHPSVSNINNKNFEPSFFF